MKPEDIDYINAHGTATHHNDLFETKAIKLALGDHAYKVKINSTTHDSMPTANSDHNLFSTGSNGWNASNWQIADEEEDF